MAAKQALVKHEGSWAPEKQLNLEPLGVGTWDYLFNNYPPMTSNSCQGLKPINIHHNVVFRAELRRQTSTQQWQPCSSLSLFLGLEERGDEYPEPLPSALPWEALCFYLRSWFPLPMTKHRILLRTKDKVESDGCRENYSSGQWALGAQGRSGVGPWKWNQGLRQIMGL